MDRVFIIIIIFLFYFTFSLLFFSHNTRVVVGWQGECVRLHTSHREDQGVQCELELSRPAQCGGAGRDNRQSGRVRFFYVLLVFNGSLKELLFIVVLHNL